MSFFNLELSNFYNAIDNPQFPIIIGQFILLSSDFQFVLMN